jgi:hypothetical protein
MGIPSFFLRTAANTYTSLPNLARNITQIPYAGLNNSGEVVGTELVNTSLGFPQAQGFLLDLTSLQRSTSFDFSTGLIGRSATSADAVNDSGIVLGSYLSGADLTIPGFSPGVVVAPFYQSVSYFRGADGSLLLSFVRKRTGNPS